MRKLATIRKIEKLSPIPGADKIEVATIGGWKVVVEKDRYDVGALCIYCEIDSWIPHHLAPFLSKGQEPREFNGIKGNRLRTVELRGQLSQGLILSLADNEKYLKSVADLVEGQDVTEQLGIQKWEAPIPAQLAGQLEGAFPSFIPKTDQERCQNLVDEIFVDNIDSEYEITIKLDGTSCTFYHNDGKVGVCGRNWEFKINEENADNTLVRLFVESGMKDVISLLGNVAIQGEVMGPGIQKNREALKHHQMFIFDIYLIDQGRYATPVERRDMIKNAFGANPETIKEVPVLAENVKLADIGVSTVDQLLQFAEGKSIVNDIREGVVFKRMDGQFSFKAISNKYLRKLKE